MHDLKKMSTFRKTSVLILVILLALKCRFSSAQDQIEATSHSEEANLLYQVIGELFMIQNENKLMVEKLYEIQNENKLMSEKIEILEGKMESLETPDEGKT